MAGPLPGTAPRRRLASQDMAPLPRLANLDMALHPRLGPPDTAQQPPRDRALEVADTQSTPRLATPEAHDAVSSAEGVLCVAL